MIRKVQASLFGVLLFCISAASVFGILTLTHQNVFDAQAASPNQVVDYYHQQTASGWESFTVRNADAVSVSLYVNHQGRVFEFSEGNGFLLYEKGQSERTFDEVKQEAASVFESIGFLAKEDTAEYVTFANTDKYCQVRTATSPTGSFAVICVSSEKLDEDVKLTSKLYDITKNNGEMLAAVRDDARIIVSVEQTADESIKYATLSFSGAEQSPTGLPRYLFGSVNGQWEYVANLHDASIPSDGKRSVSQEDLARMNDAKWEGYLSNVY